MGPRVSKFSREIGVSKRVLVVAAHPDDEVLGCGGTIAALTEKGLAVSTLFVSDGVSARGEDPKAVEKRYSEAVNSARQLACEPPTFVGLPDNRLDTLAMLDIVQVIEHHLKRLSPHWIFTHHRGDLNIDHRIVGEAVLTACRPLPGSKLEAVYAFEVLSSTEWRFAHKEAMFCPQHFVDVAATLDTKCRALGCYENELRPFPHPRSEEAVRALATWRGTQSGFRAAEAFEVIYQRQSGGPVDI